MNKKIIVIFVCIFLILVFLSFFLPFLTNKTSVQTQTIPSPTPVGAINPQFNTTQVSPQISLQPTSVAQTPFPETNTIINNITTHDSQNDPIINQNSNFTTLYLPQWNKFSISITTSPFDQGRQMAEQDFLTRLHLTQEEACKLNVTLGTPYKVNPNESGEIFHLSFCQ